MSSNLTYLDFAADETVYLFQAFSAGMRYNAMVSQAQRICECYMKHAITRSLMNNSDVMMSHNLRAIYEYMESIGLDMRGIRTEIMLLNNFYTHTRYPGRDSFMASPEDVVAAVKSVEKIIPYMQRYI